MQDGNALVVSEKLVGFRSYSSGYNSDETWETCILRGYLNGEFYDETFSYAEKELIAETTVITNSNPYCGTDGGNDTNDKIFLLSIEEVVRYFGDSGQYSSGEVR